MTIADDLPDDVVERAAEAVGLPDRPNRVRRHLAALLDAGIVALVPDPDECDDCGGDRVVEFRDPDVGEMPCPACRPGDAYAFAHSHVIALIGAKREAAASRAHDHDPNACEECKSLHHSAFDNGDLCHDHDPDRCNTCRRLHDCDAWDVRLTGDEA